MKINQQNEKTMANRPVELRKQNRPTIVHQNQNLNVSAEPSQNLSRNSERRNLNRPEKDEPENANQPTEISDQNLNRTQSIESNNSNQSDVPPTTTLFEQIALQVHRYKGNFLYLQKLPGILNLLEIFFGFLTFVMILVACNNYYDPWQSIVVSGFSGGKVEVFFLLTSTYAFITTSIFTILILISNSYEKSLNIGNFNFIISFGLFAFLMFSSILLLIELSNRNTGILVFEHHFGIKVACAIFGILNSLFYLLSSSIVFKIPSSQPHSLKKHVSPHSV